MGACAVIGVFGLVMYFLIKPKTVPPPPPTPTPKPTPKPVLPPPPPTPDPTLYTSLTATNAATLLVNGASALIQIIGNTGCVGDVVVQNGSYLNIDTHGTGDTCEYNNPHIFKIYIAI